MARPTQLFEKMKTNKQTNNNNNNNNNNNKRSDWRWSLEVTSFFKLSTFWNDIVSLQNFRCGDTIDFFAFLTRIFSPQLVEEKLDSGLT